MGGWINDHSTDVLWELHQGPTDSSHTGPDADHTKNDPTGNSNSLKTLTSSCQATLLPIIVVNS